jgi:hypothetical protein
MAKAGRKPKIVTAEHLVQIEKLSGLGLTEASIAWIIGMHPTTFIRHKATDDRITQALENGKSKAQREISDVLYEKAKSGDLGAIVWWEKTRANRHERFRQELTGADGGPIETKTSGADDALDYLRSELARIGERQRARPALASA